ncbi:hypothetical protein [Hymenobacter canadensis]|uniref:Uncharacterized protein n=1 Tax=Hymenobacter canadensis TaxID=2999067 RepID=A0ABY7LNX8_9BACT|nr:hypothetical protein [Hymenobacter canadensis]WBA40915.1 hypothetical protein O3303_13915 [Hymenobacter canadensis]
MQASFVAAAAPASAPAMPAGAVPAAVGEAAIHQPTQRPGTASLLARARVLRMPRVQPAATETTAHHPLRARHQPQQPQLEHTGAFVLGAALVVGGVVAGLLLGGWLGLGVGALVVLAGYYFVGVGLGGKHAWLEVFQEFFNM